MRDDNDGDLTDIYTDPPPKKSQMGLVRSHVIGLIPDTCPVVKSNNDGYSADTEQEMG